MKCLAAYMLAKIAGSAEPTEAEVGKILAAADIEVEKECLKSVVESIKKTGKSYDELIAAGKAKMAALPASGPAGPVVAAAAKVEEVKEKSVEEQIVAGFAFGGASSSSEEESS